MSRAGVPEKSRLSKEEICRMARTMTGAEIAWIAGVSRQRIGQIVAMRQIEGRVLAKNGRRQQRYQKYPVQHIAEVYLWEHIDIRGLSECWNWKAGRGANGFGSMRIGYEHVHWGRFPGNDFAHRLAYISVYGEIPAGKKIKRVCGNPICCNPRHMRLGKKSER